MPSNPMELLQALVLVLCLLFNVQEVPAWLMPSMDLPFWPQLPIDMPSLPGPETAEWWTAQTLLSTGPSPAQTSAEADLAAAQRAQAKKRMALAAPDAGWQPTLSGAGLPSWTGADTSAAYAGLRAAEALAPGMLSNLPASGYGRRASRVGQTGYADGVEVQAVQLASRPGRPPLGLGLLGLGVLGGAGYLWRRRLTEAVGKMRIIRR